MKSKKDRAAALEDIRRIRNSLKEIKDAQRSAIHLQLNALTDHLKKHVLDMQNKLDKYITKLNSLTEDKIAVELLEKINLELNDVGDDYAKLLKFEGDNKERTTNLKNLDVMERICTELLRIILKLQKIEDVLEIDIDNPQSKKD